MNPSTTLARVLVDELIRGGVRQVVLAPGSRSAPLAYALHDAERAGRLRLHVRVDERSAGFLAAGLVRGGGRRPVAVATTSGTAVANLHPAVLEAHHSGLPLVVLSADRPHELRGTGANQTTHQPGIFGGSTRWSADLPAPEVSPGAGVVPSVGASWRAMVCRALAAARGDLGGPAGPVHLNVAFREPLVPDLDSTDLDGTNLDGTEVDGTAGVAGRPDGGPWVASAPKEEPAAGELSGDHVGSGMRVPGSRPIADVERTVVVIGDLIDPAAARTAAVWAKGRGYPAIAEPVGSLAARALTIPHGPLLLEASSWLQSHAPDRVVVIGRPTLSRPVAALLRRPGQEVVVVAAPTVTSWADPAGVAHQVLPWSALAEVADDPRAKSTAFAMAWQRAGQRLADAVAERGLPWPSGLAVADEVAQALPAGATLVIGSSNPVRDLDLATTGRVAESPEEGIDVHANRGLAGIDGMVSTAVGVALASGRATYALLGDLTVLHDTNGLLIGPDEPRPDVTIIVVNDDGGGIFTTLEPGAPERHGEFERIFGTPTGTDLSALAAAHGVTHQRVESRADLRQAVARTPAGLSLVEVVVDRGSHRATHHALRDLAVQVLGQ